MNKLLILALLLYSISCKTSCENPELIPSDSKECHNRAADDDKYCCYYEGHNLDTDQNEKFCWEFIKKKIDDNKVQETIKNIEDGTDDHVSKKHNKVKLNCFASHLKIYSLLALLLLF